MKITQCSNILFRLCLTAGQRPIPLFSFVPLLCYSAVVVQYATNLRSSFHLVHVLPQRRLRYRVRAPLDTLVYIIYFGTFIIFKKKS